MINNFILIDYYEYMNNYKHIALLVKIQTKISRYEGSNYNYI